MQIEEAVRSFIAENILFSGNGYPFADEASFMEEGVVDSMNVLELVMFVEENYKIAVEDHEVVPDNFDSVSKLAGYIRSKAN
jgi:acyl carrier protein